MRFKRQGVFKKLYSFNLIFNYRGKTIALMFFSMSFYLELPNLETGPVTFGFEHVTLATRSEVSTGKVKYGYPIILKILGKKPLVIIFKP